MKETFGIVITTYIGDYYLTKATLASIHKYMPCVPVCIIQDGDFSLEEVLGVYNITSVIKRETVKNEFLKKCFRSRCTSMVAFWESPFERFLYLDSDLVLWGDILKHIDVTSADFIHNEPHEPYSDYIYKTQYFDFDRLFEFVEKFEWRGCEFFNTGTFISKVGIFELERFEYLFALWQKDKSLLPTDPQSMMNYLVFLLQQKNGLKVASAHLQTVVPVWSAAQLEAEFTFKNNEPVVRKDTVIHWAGVKPLMVNRSRVFTAPEVYFRKQHLINIHSIWRFMPVPYFFYEEYKSLLDRYHQGSLWVYFKKKAARFFKSE